MCIDQYLESNPVTIAPNTLLQEAIALLGQPQIDYLLVIATLASKPTKAKLSGILTKGDLLRAISNNIEPQSTTVEQIMSQPVKSLTELQCQDPQVVWSYLQEHKIKYLPILSQKDQLLGVINSQNLTQFLPTKDAGLVSWNHDQQLDHWQQQATQWAKFFEVTPSLLCITGFDGYFKFINQAFTEILGYGKAELLAVSSINFVHPEDRAATLSEITKLTTGQVTSTFENRYRTITGDYRWLLWTTKSDPVDSVFYAAAQDITQRKETEQALRENEERWQLALKGANDGIWDWNVRTNEVFFSQRWKEMLGYTVDEIGNTLEEWSKRVHPQDLAYVTEIIQEHFAQKTPFYSSEHRVLCKDGSYKWILDRGQALWDEAGNVVRMTGSHTDLSEQQVALRERRKAEIQLKQERDFSAAIINTVGALVAVLDQQGAIVSFNRTCEEITGYTYEEIKHQPVWDYLIPTEEQAAVKAVFSRLLAGQLPNKYENSWLAKDGSRHLISWSNTALFDAQGNVEFIIATGIDISEQRRVWNQLEQQYRQIKLLTEITRKIRMSIEIDDILQAAVTEVQHLLACDRVLIMKIDSSNTALPISEAILPNLPSMLGYQLSDPLLRGKYLARYRTGEVLAIDDLDHASIALDIKQLLSQFQIQAKLVVPILSQNQLQGLLIAHQCHQPRQWQEPEILLLKQLADQIGVALSQAELLDNLEELVAYRTDELTTTNQLLQAEIADRKLSEAALRENQQRLEGILDNADEAIISIDEQQKVQIFNQGAEKIFGYQAQEIIGQPLDILLPEAFRQIHHHHVQQFGQSLEQARRMADRSNDVFGRRQNGQEFPAEASVAKLSTREGILYTVMLKDITERQQTQEKLQISQKLLAKAEKIAKIGSWEYNMTTRQLTWSDELFEILGFSSSSIPSCDTIYKHIHPDDRLLVKKTLHQGHQEGKPWQINYRWVLTDGTVKYLESRGEPTVDQQHPYHVLKVWGTIMDISQRIEAEKSLQRSEQQLQLITDALPILIAYIDKEQHYLYNNRTYETWFGKPRSSLVGRSMSEIIGQENYQKMLPYIKTVLKGKAVTFENQPTAENGSSYWVSATYIPDFDSDGEVKGFFSMVDDITDRKAIEQMKSEFVSIASHEMRTPLTSIHGVIKLLCAGRLGELSASGRNMAEMALRNSDRLIRLVNDILDLERMESGKDQIEKRSCNSAELIEQAIDTLRAIAEEQHINLETKGQGVTFQGDRDRLIQTLTNLLSNAIKFSPVNSQVWVSSRLQNETVLFTVQDRGRGIPQDKLETIFERFQQVDASDSRKKGGTGLGLAICRHIVEQHGGKIWVESIYGQGSTFFIAVPRS
ncbi:MAG: PAS domain S-box protein [Cyanobacteria bacterium J06638_38]